MVTIPSALNFRLFTKMAEKTNGQFTTVNMSLKTNLLISESFFFYDNTLKFQIKQSEEIVFIKFVSL